MTAPRPTIPRHEPEAIAAATKKRRGDPEKVRTTAISGLDVDGVALSSRYDKAYELEDMVAMVEAVPPSLRALIGSLFCDSQAQACYSVELKACSQSQARLIASHLARAANSRHGGSHNSINLQGAAGGQIFLDPGME